MIALKVSVNGQRICLAGAKGETAIGCEKLRRSGQKVARGGAKRNPGKNECPEILKSGRSGAFRPPSPLSTGHVSFQTDGASSPTAR